MVRPGILAYGYGHPDLKPVMELRSKVMMVRSVGADTPVSYGSTYRTKEKTRLALIPAGYADGYCRALSNKGRVSIGGKFYPVAGRVCMDQFIVDLGPQSGVEEGDEVILFGPSTPELTAETLAADCGTISYEILCGISRRVPRIYA
jgi:alanine racemase